MEFKEYVKNGRVIRATETAYKAIYEAQGFVLKTKEKPKSKPPAKEVVTNEGTEGDNTDGGGTGDNGESASAGKSKRTKQ